MRLTMRRHDAVLIATCTAAMVAVACSDSGPSAPGPEAGTGSAEPGVSATYLIDHGQMTLLSSSRYSESAKGAVPDGSAKLERMLNEAQARSLQMRVQAHLSGVAQRAAVSQGMSERRPMDLRLLPSTTINGHVVQFGIAIGSKGQSTPDGQVVWIDGSIAAAFEMSFDEVRGKAHLRHMRTTLFGKDGARVLVRDDERGGTDVAQSTPPGLSHGSTALVQLSTRFAGLQRMFMPDALYAATLDGYDPDEEGPCASFYEEFKTTVKESVVATAAMHVAQQQFSNAATALRAAEAAVMEAGELAGPALQLAVVAATESLATAQTALDAALAISVASAFYAGEASARWINCKLKPPKTGSTGTGSSGGGSSGGISSGTIGTSRCTAYYEYTNGVLTGISDPNLCFDVIPQVT